MAIFPYQAAALLGLVEVGSDFVSADTGRLRVLLIQEVVTQPSLSPQQRIDSLAAMGAVMDQHTVVRLVFLLELPI